MHNPREESIALLDEHDNFRVSEDDGAIQSSAVVLRKLKAQRYVTIALLAFSLLDVLVFLYVARLLASSSDTAFENLEFRNSYIGLEELYRSGNVNASHHDPIINIPRIATQVSNIETHKNFPEGEHQWLSDYGTLLPPDRHLQVSSEIHTIMQFRAVDYGMERCALTLRLPAFDFDRIGTRIDPVVMDDPVQLSVCALDVSSSLNPRTLSWSSRPRCQKQVGTLIARPGEEVKLPEFSCDWASLHTYEIACASESSDCELDVWSNQNATWGIFMYQYQTR
ncbi:hypothetical protein SERLA73DRAFT_178509 [Serpula lacrymans var. lacrymans S7.3]|uniref:Ubiquitin 3 binding protein But2 C-terminal domain-containing protein n=2 Tax=Serpula lacrymans var. lacrymans TaxID=341189 RepID=F8PRS3_SERL3|nr:uncharacterized protein SERLADRAFT_462996 [Serpula lacrymans var. lacrymans S7.9]EGO00643.1 hypothetical protein SERLA73DRAFT_178509 [Serpula lacrymans var. lacrymans S7.3]EGO26198.1 hypothetical protein SERLADRAFT_462996 [Serpula lacrymans var. lacrymans S7.9]